MVCKTNIKQTFVDYFSQYVYYLHRGEECSWHKEKIYTSVLFGLSWKQIRKSQCVELVFICILEIHGSRE